MLRSVAAFLMGVASLAGASKILVTVVDPKSGIAVPNLKAADFNVLDDKAPRQVEAAEYSQATLLDIMLLLDTSLAGEMVQPVANNLIAQLQPKEQMAIVSFHSSADLIQDFTSSQELLRRAVAKVKYGNTPHVLDAVYAAADGGFQSSSFRRVILLLTAGVEGPSRTEEKQVIRLARHNGVSIYPIYVLGYERSMMEMLARGTGGASFSLKSMKKASDEPPGPAIFEVLRSHYLVTVSGNLGLGEKLKVEVRRPEKLFVSALPLE
jgi:VWFA-related protein